MSKSTLESARIKGLESENKYLRTQIVQLQEMCASLRSETHSLRTKHAGEVENLSARCLEKTCAAETQTNALKTLEAKCSVLKLKIKHLNAKYN